MPSGWTPTRPRSTRASGCSRITADPLRVGVHFTSQQDPDLAPKDLPVGCIDWTIVYQIESQDGRLVVGQAVPGSVTKAKC